MRIVHLSYDYGLKGTSGGPIAASRLHLALLRAGVDSHFVCVRQLESGPNVHQLPRSRIGRKLFYFIPRVFWVLSKLVTGQMLMPNIWPLPGFGKLMRELNPDVVHIHLIAQDMVSFRQLAAIDAKFVYTLHDLTAVNAVEPHPRADRRFAEGFTKANSSRAERWMFERKRRFLLTINPVFVGPSDWVCGMLKESEIWREISSQTRQDAASTRIHNIVDPTYRFDPELVQEQEKFTILFGAFGGRVSPYKGWVDLEAALMLLPEDVRRKTVVRVFGESAADYEIDGVEVRFMGSIGDPEKMRALHHEADLYALPSRQDNAPQVKFEAFLDGLPVVAFQRTGCAEFIVPRQNGWIAPDGDLADYAKGIEYFFGLWERGELGALRPKIAEAAAEMFAEEKILSAMKDVYSRC